MIAIRKTVIQLASLSLIAALIIAGHPARVFAKDFCWEECTFEWLGGCWHWKKACLDLSEQRDEPLTPRGKSYDRSPDRQQLPSQVGSLLAGGGLSTALDTDVKQKSFSDLGGDLLH